MSKMLKLKNLLAEAFYYDVSIEKNQFESAVADATEQSKKKFESSMKEKVLNQKVRIKASKGQPGQPIKNYIIDKVADASIDWYWKQYMVVFKDEKGKEYFLKPGFKVEVLSASGQPGDNTQQAPKEPAAPQAQKPTDPSPVAPGTKQASKPATGAPTKPMAPAAPAPNQKAPVAERTDVRYNSMIATLIGDAIWDFLSPEKQEGGNPAKAVYPYIVSTYKAKDTQGNADNAEEDKWQLTIPEKDLIPGIDPKDIQLEITTALRRSGGPGGEYTRGYADVEKIGRVYKITITYHIGMDI